MEIDNRRARVRVSIELIEAYLNYGTVTARPTHNLHDIHIDSALCDYVFGAKGCEELNAIELFISSPDLEPIKQGQDMPLIDLAFEQVKG